jgi:hypothetical protein
MSYTKQFIFKDSVNVILLFIYIIFIKEKYISVYIFIKKKYINKLLKNY